MEALRSHGYLRESVALARAVARTIREKAADSFQHQEEEGPQKGIKWPFYKCRKDTLLCSLMPTSSPINLFQFFST